MAESVFKICVPDENGCVPTMKLVQVIVNAFPKYVYMFFIYIIGKTE